MFGNVKVVGEMTGKPDQLRRKIKTHTLPVSFLASIILRFLIFLAAARALQLITGYCPPFIFAIL